MKSYLESEGFTLIEILIAIVILSVSLLALAALMGTTTRNTSFGGHITEAATYAQDQLEKMRATSWTNIANNWVDETGQPLRTGPSGIAYSRTLNVVTNGDIKTVTITVSWTDPTNRLGPHSFNIVSAFTQ